jgi:hypothetical protein
VICTELGVSRGSRIIVVMIAGLVGCFESSLTRSTAKIMSVTVEDGDGMSHNVGTGIVPVDRSFSNCLRFCHSRLDSCGVGQLGLVRIIGNERENAWIVVSKFDRHTSWFPRYS